MSSGAPNQPDGGVDWEEPAGFPADATRDRLIGDWYLYQRRGGHRTSTDDVLVAWFASVHAAAPVMRYLDLGCGIGSVLMMTTHRLRPAHCEGVEAQPQSVEMARRSISELPAGAPTMTVAHHDFRDFKPASAFDLVTGSPPYFPLGTGVLPDDSQRRACRFEARGGVEAYCETAKRVLAPAGRFVLVHQTEAHERVVAAAAAHDLVRVAQCDVHMREDRRRPFLSVYALAHRAEANTPVHQTSLTIRDASGEHTDGYRQARRALGVE